MNTHVCLSRTLLTTESEVRGAAFYYLLSSLEIGKVQHKVSEKWPKLSYLEYAKGFDHIVFFMTFSTLFYELAERKSPGLL